MYLFDDNQKPNLKIITINQLIKIKFDRIIISPGIDISNCKLSKFLNINLDKIYTDLDVFYSFYKNTSIAITGTNGKSTTAKILFDILKDQKKDVRLIGNIGNPALSEKKISKKTFFVIEVSSYQLEYSKMFSAKYAVILNISVDHIERHKNLTNYVNAKFKLLDSQNNKSFAFVKKNDRLINQKIRKNKFKPKIYKVDTLNINKLSNQLNNKYFISDGNKENLSFIFRNYHKQFNRILRNKIKIKKFKNLKETLKKIFFEIKKQKINKNTIFFSPAGASFDSFKNFEDRGKYFDQLIKKFVNAN